MSSRTSMTFEGTGVEIAVPDHVHVQGGRIRYSLAMDVFRDEALLTILSDSPSVIWGCGYRFSARIDVKAFLEGRHEIMHGTLDCPKGDDVDLVRAYNGGGAGSGMPWNRQEKLEAVLGEAVRHVAVPYRSADAVREGFFDLVLWRIATRLSALASVAIRTGELGRTSSSLGRDYARSVETTHEVFRAVLPFHERGIAYAFLDHDGTPLRLSSADGSGWMGPYDGVLHPSLEALRRELQSAGIEERQTVGDVPFETAVRHGTPVLVLVSDNLLGRFRRVDAGDDFLSTKPLDLSSPRQWGSVAI